MVTNGNGNGNGIVMEWVGYPFATAMAMATHLIALHFAIAVAIDTPSVNTCKDAVAVAVTQCERTLKGMSRLSIQRIKAMLLYIVYGILFVDTVDTKIKACNALNAMFVKTVNTTVKTHLHIPAHNFLNIQPIFNPQKVLES